jgi:hypothetical protein
MESDSMARFTGLCDSVRLKVGATSMTHLLESFESKFDCRALYQTFPLTNLQQLQTILGFRSSEVLQNAQSNSISMVQRPIPHLYITSFSAT